jgi:hypothetical protein
MSELEKVYELVERAAIRGERCPQNDELAAVATSGPELLRALAKAGRLRIEVSGRNWRTVTILAGPHAGKRTQRDPMGGRHPHITIDGSGTHKVGKWSMPVTRPTSPKQEPSAPRLLTREEIDKL